MKLSSGEINNEVSIKIIGIYREIIWDIRESEDFVKKFDVLKFWWYLKPSALECNIFYSKSQVWNLNMQTSTCRYLIYGLWSFKFQPFNIHFSTSKIHVASFKLQCATFTSIKFQPFNIRLSTSKLHVSSFKFRHGTCNSEKTFKFPLIISNSQIWSFSFWVRKLKFLCFQALGFKSQVAPFKLQTWSLNLQLSEF